MYFEIKKDNLGILLLKYKPYTYNIYCVLNKMMQPI